MTPQDLINVKGYGQANKLVKALGFWQETLTDTDRIQWLEDNGATIRFDSDGEPIIKATDNAFCIDELREDIDNAATKHTAELHSAYLEDYK